MTMPRSEKCGRIYSVVIGAAISVIPVIIGTLVFGKKIEFLPGLVLWVLTTLVLIENWWWADSLFTSHSNDSVLVIALSLVHLLTLLGFTGVLFGADVDLARSLRYYGILLAVISVADALMCLAYWWSTHDDEFWINIALSGFAALTFIAWTIEILPHSTLLAAVGWLMVFYGGTALLEKLFQYLFIRAKKAA